MGSCDTVRVDEIGDTYVIIFKQGIYCVNNECLIICVSSLIHYVVVPTTTTCEWKTLILQKNEKVP